MATGSAIEWTEATWNPVTGCTRVSAGCDHCYAATMTKRLAAMGQTRYAGLLNDGKKHFNGVVKCHDDVLEVPLHWRKPRRVFVNSMSDLFHESVPFDFIDKVFAVMALATEHTFQVLTKRPERMAEYLATRNNEAIGSVFVPSASVGMAVLCDRISQKAWPLSRVWLGVSCEDQRAADERIPHLLRCPAAVRFLSVEPMLGEIDFRGKQFPHPFLRYRCQTCRDKWGGDNRMSYSVCTDCGGKGERVQGIDWVIFGGESGPGARPCNVDWIRYGLRQCKAAGVPAFVKQLGACFSDPLNGVAGPRLKIATEARALLLRRLKHPKCGDPSEWPEDLRVREYPK